MALWNQGVSLFIETGSEEKILIFKFLPTPFFTLKILLIIVFMVLKTNGFCLDQNVNQKMYTPR